MRLGIVVVIVIVLVVLEVHDCVWWGQFVVCLTLRVQVHVQSFTKLI